ncbi:mandelate racemase/muconate lactonizing enzyme family protein [Candidatus Woesearchaeota archaeon]|nr:mandelate racemase/muconate lactonizing enzyme family protein [Candidatus Woesearchaeota archaeon]
MNVPVYQLLGGKMRDKVPAYANGWYTVEREPKQFQSAALAVVGKGYKGLKFDPFGSGNHELSRKEFRRSIDLIKAVNEAVPEYMQIFVEMHGRFSPHQALEIADAIYDAGIRPGWIEEPCRPTDLKGHAYVRSKSKIPVATGERLYPPSDFHRLFELGGADIIQVDPTNFGVLQAMKLVQAAETHSIMVAPHNVGGVISTLAGIHLMAAIRPAKVLEHFNDYADAHVKKAADWYTEVTDGEFTVPNKPGWGVELDLEFIAKHPPKMRGDVILDPGLNLFHNSRWHERGQKKLTE